MLQDKLCKMKTIVLVTFIALLTFYSCNSNHKDKQENSTSEITVDSIIKKNNDSNDNFVDSQDVLYVKPNTLVFFSLSNKEFKQFIHRTGKQSEWDFELIYKRFKKQAKNTKEALKNEKVHSIYTFSPKIAFITEKDDTLFFDRKENDLFLGQIFFNGKDTLDIEEGLMKKDSLIDRIKNYFSLKEEINIKQTVIHSVYQKVIKKDTIVKLIPDTVKTP